MATFHSMLRRAACFEVRLGAGVAGHHCRCPVSLTYTKYEGIGGNGSEKRDLGVCVFLKEAWSLTLDGDAVALIPRLSEAVSDQNLVFHA